MSRPVQILVGTAAAVFLIIVAVVGVAYFTGHQERQREQSKRTPICTEVFNKATETIQAQQSGTLADHVAEAQSFFALTRQRASEVSQSDPGFSAALREMNLTVDGVHALDAYC